MVAIRLLWSGRRAAGGKHVERYMPREAVEALKRQGVWRGEEAQ
ncbi:MAG: hypothetical protein WA813_19815 [Beijerinckiaceae bacterium]|jgi:hypothetical protein